MTSSSLLACTTGRSAGFTSRTSDKMGRSTRVKKTTPSTNDKARGKSATLRWRLPDAGLGAGCPARLYRRYIVTSGRAARGKLGNLGKDERLRCTWIAAKHNIHRLTRQLS